MTETLYNLTNNLLKLQEFVESTDNLEEMLEAITETENDLNMSIDDKLEGMMTIRANKMARVEALKAEAKRLEALAKSEENEVKKIEDYTQFELTKLGMSYKSKKAFRPVGKFNVGFKKLPPKLEIMDESKIPMLYKNIPPTPAPKPDSKELLDLLKKKAEDEHGKKWTKEIDELVFEEYGIKLVNNNQKFEVK